ncbi:uncharacterized protein [Elaeis guineensis]|uniref:uncharacterized protein isoform X2 n=1 Tax=Elaeis guineensis var. tenera TaxID=51953 RepID=UPI003C6D2FE4
MWQGLGNNTGDYQGLAMALRERYGIPSVVARVSRFDWLRYAAGLLDANFWKGTLGPRPVLDWYLERVDEAVSEANQLCPRDKGGSISFIGHSAGGWLARIYMEEFELSHISLLLTLGSPHIYFRPPPAGLPGVIDQTRGLLDYVEKNCAPAVYTPQRKYVCIAGRYIQGATLAGNSDVTSGMTPTIDKDQGMAESVPNVNNNKSISLTPTLRAYFIGQGYKQLCGQADVWGDGVVPEMSAHLEGALNMSLDGVCHSPIGSDDRMRPWYGSPSVLEKWVHHLLNP